MMEQASWRSKFTAAGLGITIPLLWSITQTAAQIYLVSKHFQWYTISFGEHFLGLVLLLVIIPLYNKLPQKIKVGTVFNERSFWPIMSVLIIYLVFTAYELLSGTHQETWVRLWVKLIVLTPWPYAIPLFLTILVLVPLGEEIAFRGYMANAFPLEKKWGVIASAFVTSALFSCMHYAHLVSFIEIVALCFVFIWARIRSGGLGLPIFLHFLANALDFVSGLLLPLIL